MGRLGPTAEANLAAPNHCGMPSRCASADTLGTLLCNQCPCDACLPAQLAGQLWKHAHQRSCCTNAVSARARPSSLLQRR